MDERSFKLLIERLLRAHGSKPRPKAAALEIPLLGPGQLKAFASQLLSLQYIKTPEALVLITLLLTREWPEPNHPALRKLAGDAARTGVCGTVWKQDELAYKCKTCERDPTCAICVPCFRHGDHKGHDYAMIRTGGGCCDCGDVQAWKSNGFCSRHRGACGEDEDPALPMSPELRLSLVEVMSAVSSVILEYCRRFYKSIRVVESDSYANKNRQHSSAEDVCDGNAISLVVTLLTWMSGIVDCGDGIRRVVGVYLSKPAKTSWLNAMLKLDGIGRLPSAVQASLHTLYFQLITDLVFKRAFLEMFVENYPRFVQSLCFNCKASFSQTRTEDPESRKNDIMDNFSVQLFTVPALISVMMRDGGLLDVLINMILHLLEAASMPVLPYIDVQPGKSQFEMIHNMGHVVGEVESHGADSVANPVHEGFSKGVSSAPNVSNGTMLPHGGLPLPLWLFKGNSKSGNVPEISPRSLSTRSQGIYRRNNSAGISNDENVTRAQRFGRHGTNLHRFTQVSRRLGRTPAPYRAMIEPQGEADQGNTVRGGFHFRFAPDNPSRPTEAIRRPWARTAEVDEDSTFEPTNTGANPEHTPTVRRFVPPMLHRRTGFVPPGTLITRIPNVSTTTAVDGGHGSTANDFSNDAQGQSSHSLDGLREIVRDGLQVRPNSTPESPTVIAMLHNVEGVSQSSDSNISIHSVVAGSSSSGTHASVISGDCRSTDCYEFEGGENLDFLDRDLLKKIREIQKAALEVDMRDGPARAPQSTNALDERQFLQLQMFEQGLDNIDPVFRDSPCNLGTEPWGKFYKMSVMDAKRRSRAAAMGTGNIAHTLRVEWFNSQILESAVWRVIYDLKYVLTHGPVAVHMVHKRPDLFRLYVRILSMMQGINPVRRAFGDHLSVEPESWSKAFTLEIEMSQITHFLVVAFCKSPKGWLSNGTLNPKEGQFTAERSRSRCVKIVRQCLNEWIDREKGLESMSIHFGEEFSVAHSVSVHFPLHRLLSVLAYHSLRLDGISPDVAVSGTSSGSSPDEAMDLLRHPLRIQVFLAHVRAGMWKRNGRCVVGQALLYRSIICADWFVDMDLFLQQTCAIIAGESRFVRETLNAFQITSFPSLLRLHDVLTALGRGEQIQGLENFRFVSTTPVAKSDVNQVVHALQQDFRDSLNRIMDVAWMQTSLGEDAYFGTAYSNLALGEYVPSIVEDLFTYLVHVTTERSRCGFDDRLSLRRKLIHALAWSDQTHSELLRASPRRSQQPTADDDVSEPAALGTEKADALVSSLVDETLNEIADFEQPHGMQQGRYRLKDHAWKEFDRFSPQLSVRHRSTAEERYTAACKRLNINPLPFQFNSVSELPIYAEYEGLKKIASYLCGQESGSLASMLLNKCLPAEGGLRALEGSLPGALYFVCMAVEFATPQSSESFSSKTNVSHVFNTWLSTQMNTTFGRPRDCLRIISEIYCLTSDAPGSPFNEVRHGLERILQKAHIRGCSILKMKLSEEIPSLFGESSAVGSRGTDFEQNTLVEASKRRKMIMEMKKKMQASAMEQMRASQERFEKLLESSEDEADCDKERTLGKECGCTSPHSCGDCANNAQAAEKKHLLAFESQTCALCREEAPKNGGRLGLVGFLQTTKVPSIIEKRCELERRRALAVSENNCKSVATTEGPGRSEFITNVENQVAQVVENENAMEEEAFIPPPWRNFFVAGNVEDMTAMVGTIIQNTAQPGAFEVEGTLDIIATPDGNEGVIVMHENDSMEGVTVSAGSAQFSPNAHDVHSERRNVETSQDAETKKKFLGWDFLHRGSEQAIGVHFGFCGHSIHTKCFERYFQSLVDSQRRNGRFEGDTLVMLEKGEFLCPFCRRIANFLLPVSETEVEIPLWKRLHGLSSSEICDKYAAWLKTCDTTLADRMDDQSGRRSSSNSGNMAGSGVESAGDVSRGLEIVSQILRGDQQTFSDNSVLQIARLGKHELDVLCRLGSWIEWTHEDFAHRYGYYSGKKAGCINVLMSSVSTTIVCAEIESRSNFWDGTTSELKRRNIGLLIREARTQAKAFRSLAKHHLNRLWHTLRATDLKRVWDIDAFSGFVLMVLLWQNDISLEDLHGMLRVSYELALKQAIDLAKSYNHSEGKDYRVDETDVLLFLRRAAIFLSCYLDLDISIASYQVNHEYKVMENELAVLQSELALPSVEEYASELKMILTSPTSMLSLSAREFVRKPFQAVRVGLIKLPPQFQDLLEWLDGRVCNICCKHPDKPVLCLACGDLICYKLPSRHRKRCKGHTEHIDVCGGGVGVLLVLKMTSVIVFREKRNSRWGSPYLDEHGEEDHELHRGKPLYLSKERYESLEKLWLSHGFDHDFRVLHSSQLALRL